ncbi:MAG: ATP-binding protein [Planctomycetota bacterium]
MTRAPWSIERRLARWITLSTIAMASLFSGAVVWIAAVELHDELNILGREEIEELEANLRGRSFTRAELQDILNLIAVDHLDHRFSWRLWQPGAGRAWATFGPTPRTPLPETWDEAGAMALAPIGATRWHHVDVPLTIPGDPSISALRVGLLLDALPRRESATRALGLVIGLVAVIALIAIFGGTLLARQVARTLREATARARELDAQGTVDTVAPNHAPSEVVALANAFRGNLDELRRQYSRNLLLTAGMAHELRSPLQNMMGEASVALLRDRSPDEYRAVLESQLEEMRDLGRVVDNLITLTALREHGALARKERFQLGAETELRLQKEAAHAAKRGISFEVQRDGDLEVEGDREALLLAIRNLVDNALRHVDAGGHVEVHLHGDDQAVVAMVDDDGPGVPQELRTIVFEAFRQAEAKARRRGSYGLGLALARAAAEAHGGTIHVEPAPIGGARFVITLPRQGAANAAAEGPSRA